MNRILLAATLLLVAPRALAGDDAGAASAPSEAHSDAALRAAERATARELTFEGIQAFEDADYSLARSKFERALSLVRAPTVALWLGRTLELQGQLVQAREFYFEATRTPVVGDQQIQERAQQQATERLEALDARIPRIRCVISGAPADAVAATLNGGPVPSALLGAPIPVNPGTHEVVVTWRGQSARKTLTVKEGELGVALLSLAADGIPPVKPEPAPASSSPFKRVESPSAPARGAAVAPISWFAVGGAGLLVGTVAAFVGLNRRDELLARCDGRECGPDQHDAVRAYNQARVVSVLGFAVGAAGVSVGTVLLRRRPPPPPESASTARAIAP
jgi:hypothetical protein